MPVRRNMVSFGNLAIAAFLAFPAHGQTTAPKPSPLDVEGGETQRVEDGEIVVTAQRREQSLSDVGVSIAAIAGDVLARRNFNSPSDLSTLVPALSVSDSGFSTPIYTLRGVGVNEQSVGSNSSVAVYVDEVPLVFPIMTQGAALDLERVEVLKGPQGTLYGQNSTGGAINYIANKPRDRFEAGVTGTLGRFTRGMVEGFISGPLNSTLQARVAARASFGGDWQRSLTRDETLGRVENYSGRIIVEWRPSDRFEMIFNGNGWIDRSDTLVPQLVKVIPSSVARVDRNIVVLNPAGAPVLDINGMVVTRPELLSSNARDTDWDAGYDYARDDDFWQASLRAEWALSDQVGLTSITSYAKLNRRSIAEADGTAVSENLLQAPQGSLNSFQQELRFTADISDVHWLVGANYGRDNTSENNLQFLRDASGVRNIFGFAARGTGLINRQKIENWSVFTAIDVPLADRLTFSGGIRLSNDSRTFQGCGYVLPNGGSTDSQAFTALLNFFRAGAGLTPLPLIPEGQCFSFYSTAAAQRLDTAGIPLLTPGFANRRLAEDNVPWNLNLNFKPSRNSLIYARVSRGFKAGNFSTIGSTDSIAYRPVVQEKLTAYELGARTRLGSHIRVEAAIFQYDYTDKQLRARIFVGPPFGNINAQDTIPKSRLRGAEFSLTATPFEGLTVGASGTYIDSEIRRYTGQTVDGVLQDQAGAPFNFTPKYSFNGDIFYQTALFGSLDGFAGVNVAYRSKTSAVFNPPGGSQLNLQPFDIRGHTLVDGQIGVETTDGKIRAFLWGKNILNQYYWTNVVRVSDVVVKFPGMPVSYGATLSYRF